MTEGDIAFRCVTAFVDELVTKGLQHACVSPGSRSTPIALALARHPGVRVHVHLDERASAFFALGMAKATNVPVAVACTSGTASAEFLPAVVEAAMSRTPLLLLTADRPPELRGVGANQTIDQAELYGRFAKVFVEAPVPGDEPADEGWRGIATRVFDASLSGPTGPVHVNLPFREPLVPSDTEPPDAFGGRGVSAPAERISEVDDFVAELRGIEEGVIVAGTVRGPDTVVVDLAGWLEWPLLAEPTSGIRIPGALSAGQFLLTNEGFVDSHRPRLVVQLGSAPTSRAGLAFVSNADRLVIVDPDHVVGDPGRRAARTFPTSVAALARAALDHLPAREESRWIREWSRADRRAREAVDGYLDAGGAPFEGRVARDLAAGLPIGSTLVVGSSMPVRDLDAFMLPREGVRVLANRGASGIDGFLSTALGVSATGAATTALCGDLTLLHDVGSLVWSARRGYDCVFVVPNNDGGAIFSFLPQRDLPEFDELFTTPHGLDLGGISRTVGAGHARIEQAADLMPSVDRARDLGGVHIVEVPTDRTRNVEMHREVHAAVAAALERPTM